MLCGMNDMILRLRNLDFQIDDVSWLPFYPRGYPHHRVKVLIVDTAYEGLLPMAAIALDEGIQDYLELVGPRGKALDKEKHIRWFMAYSVKFGLDFGVDSSVGDRFRFDNSFNFVVRGDSNADSPRLLRAFEKRCRHLDNFANFKNDLDCKDPANPFTTALR